MEPRFLALAVLVLFSSSFSLGVYLITDYYMDDGWSKTFSQKCDEKVKDDCAYINSHVNTFGLTNYDSDISCTMMLDAGKQGGAKYKFSWKRFDLEASADCAADSLTLYDKHMDNVNETTEPFGTFCGGTEPSVAGFPSQRYVTLKFRTNGDNNAKGFKLMATRTVPYPCPDEEDYFHCKSENICIDKRLHCDGTIQCADETDEEECTGGDKFIGSILSLGLGQLVTIVLTVIFGSIALCVGISIFTCCRKRCDCLFRGCSRLRKAVGACAGRVCGSACTSIHARCWDPMCIRIHANCWDPMCVRFRARVLDPIRVRLAERCARGKWSSKVCTVGTDDVMVEAICKYDNQEQCQYDEEKGHEQGKDNDQSTGDTPDHVDEFVVNAAAKKEDQGQNQAQNEGQEQVENEAKTSNQDTVVDGKDNDQGENQAQNEENVQEVVVESDAACKEEGQEETQAQGEGQNEENIQEVVVDAPQEQTEEQSQDQSQEIAK